MRRLHPSHLKSWLFPAAVIVLATIVVIVAPEEQTLGRGIKVVYVHVAFIWTGMVSLLLTGLAGLYVAAANHGPLQAWNRILGWIGLGLFAVGLMLSAPAARMNWGGVYWQEPRTLAALQVVAAGLIVQVLAGWPIPVRLRGLLHTLMALFMVYTIQMTPLVLHPRDPARSSSAAAIRGAFFSLFALASLLAAWILYQTGPRASRELVTGAGSGAAGPDDGTVSDPAAGP
jgi:hypothetical protein